MDTLFPLLAVAAVFILAACDKKTLAAGQTAAPAAVTPALLATEKAPAVFKAKSVSVVTAGSGIIGN